MVTIFLAWSISSNSRVWYSLKVWVVTVVLIPPGTMVWGWGYLPQTSTHISRARRVISRASRYSLPVSGFMAVIRSAMRAKPWTWAWRVGACSALAHRSGLVALTIA